MSSSGFAAGADFDRARLEPFEVGHVQWLRRFGDDGRETVAAGYWVVTPEEAPEPFTITGQIDEVIVLLEGRLTIEISGGDTLELSAGSSAALSAGLEMRWTIHEPVVEFFVYA